MNETMRRISPGYFQASDCQAVANEAERFRNLCIELVLGIHAHTDRELNELAGGPGRATRREGASQSTISTAIRGCECAERCSLGTFRHILWARNICCLVAWGQASDTINALDVSLHLVIIVARRLLVVRVTRFWSWWCGCRRQWRWGRSWRQRSRSWCWRRRDWHV